MNRKIPVFILVLMLTATAGFAQTDSLEERGFKKENLFTGGSVSLSFGNGGFGAGVMPVFGYSITKWLDAGIALNYLYVSQRYSSTIKLRQSIYGAGPMVRIYPVKFLFLQGQFEHNIISYKQIYENGNPTEKLNHNANSLLAGAGYATGRGQGGAFGYFSVLFDVLDDPESPYYSYEQLQSGEVIRSRTPVIRAGFHIPLFQGRNNRNR